MSDDGDNLAEGPFTYDPYGNCFAVGTPMLFVIVNGRFSGEYVALTSRTTTSSAEQFAKQGWASVVVHRITNPTSSFDGSERDADPVGMAFIDKLALES
ncbi:MAG: hypothetical protein JO208_14200 [Alphaproteobacteria bacterium]|nr:hypothetical protein [Alphaproteobacteria bacterium]